MPYAEYWTPPPIALVHQGVTVYHTYHHDNPHDLLSDYWYTFDPYSAEEDGTYFDLRDEAMDDLDVDNPDHRREMLRRLIDDPDFLAEWLPEDLEPPPYRTDCPQCQAPNPGFLVLSCTFRTGALAFSPLGVTLTPDLTPAMVDVQCKACHEVFGADLLRRPSSARSSRSSRSS